MLKLFEVCLFCDTPEQVEAARNYLNLVNNAYCTDGTPAANNSRIILARLNKFLHNTTCHIENGYHFFNDTDAQTNNKYPDINDYLGDILPIKFRNNWIRGKSCVLGPK